MTVWDAVVVGAGPAGAAAAGRLAGAGARVLLLDRARFPRDKPCGGGLTPRAWRHLGALVDDLVLCRAASVQVRVGAGFSARFLGRRWPVLMVRRRDLDLRLVEEAVRRGVELHEGEPVRGVEMRPEALVESNLGRYRARVVVGADGAESRVARWLGLPRPRRWMVALDAEMEVAGDPLAGEAVVDFGVPWGYAWAFPKGKLCNVGVGTFHPRHARELRWRLHRFLKETGITPARPPAIRGGRIPTGLPPGPLHRGNALLAGDAAGVADPFFAEGIPYALLSGRLAAEAAVGLLEGRSPDLSPYTRRLRAALEADARLWRATAAVVHRFPVASVRLLAASGRLQRLVERTVAGEVTVGKGLLT